MTADFLMENLTSTHALLVRLLAAETGMAEAVSPAEQHSALTQAYPQLKALALSQVDGLVAVEFSRIGSDEVVTAKVSGQEDALAFVELYRGLQTFLGGAQISDEYTGNALLAHWVHPYAARRIEAQPELARVMQGALRAHHERVIAPVRERNLEVLRDIFRFSEAFLDQV